MPAERAAEAERWLVLAGEDLRGADAMLARDARTVMEPCLPC